MNRNQWIKALTRATVILVSVIATVAFTLSYRNLVTVAYSAGMSRVEANLWPLLLDAPILIFTVAGILARLTRRRHWPYLLMVTLYSGLTMYFNFPLSAHYLWIVYLIAPLSVVLSFETLATLINVAATKSKPAKLPLKKVRGEKAIELYQQNGNISETARALKISRYKIKQLLNGDK